MNSEVLCQLSYPGSVCHAHRMGWKEFAASVIDNVLAFLAAMTGHLLSWPVMVFAVVLLLLGPIRKLIGRMKVAKGWGSEVEFEIESLSEASGAAVLDITDAAQLKFQMGVTPKDSTDPAHSASGTGQQGSARPQEAPQPGGSRSETTYEVQGGDRGKKALRFDAMARSHPRQAILTAWANVRGKVIRLHSEIIGPLPSEGGTMPILEALAETGRVPGSFLGAVEALHDLRARAHQFEEEVDVKFARGYVGSALEVEFVADELLARVQEESAR